MRQDQPCSQQLLLEQISTLLKGFKKMLKIIQEIIAEMVEEEDYNPHLKQLMQSATQLEKQAQVIDYVLPSQNDIQSIFLRFVNRLGEHIVNVSKPTSSYAGSNFIEKLFSKMQDCLKIVKTSRNVGALFLSIFSIFKQFLVVAERLYYSEPLPEDGVFVEKNITINHNHVKVNQQQPPAQPQMPPKESQFQKVMNVLNGYYSSLNCLDLDFSSFKTFYFRTRTQTEQNLVEQMTQKNGMVNKAMTKYNKRFQDFKKKKEKIEQRRTKLVSLQDLQPTPNLYFERQRHTIMSNYHKPQTLKETIQEEYTKRGEGSQRNKNPQQKIQSKDQTKQVDNSSACKKKNSYNIKNVYLTFRKPLMRQDKDSYSNNPNQFHTSLQPIDLSKTIQQNEIDKKYLKFNQKHIKLSPVKLISFAQPNLKNCLLQQLQTHKITMLGIGKPAGTIHNHNRQKMKETQFKSVRASSFARKLSKQFRFRAQDRVLNFGKAKSLLNQQ